MNEFARKSIRTLELDEVLSLLSAEARSEKAKEMAMSLLPSEDPVEVSRLLKECSDAKELIGRFGSPAFSGVYDVTLSLSRAKMGGGLTPKELLAIAALLKTAKTVKSYIDGEGAEPGSLYQYFANISYNRYLEEMITSAIISEEEIADHASGELATIRRHIRAAGSKVRDVLNRIISSPAYAKVLQDPIITMRSDRYVVPVKSEYRGTFPGLVHDVSSSGATLFIEPMQVVELNNELRVLDSKEKEEIERILMNLSKEAASFSDEITMSYESLVELDFIFAKAKLSYKMNASAPQISPKGKIDLIGARHPLLDAKTAVPIDVRLGDDFDTLIVTGPNTGGKTVTLKTIGILTLMAQCGLHIPVKEGSVVSVFDNVLADIGDEQSIEQSLSTFSSHITNIVKILSAAERDSLILFDELGAGTDPVEGAAIAIAIIEAARKKGAKIAATTHYAELKTFAMTTKGVQNASCEFDIETLRPTYRLLIGMPGKSNAFAIAQRLGMDSDVIERGKSLIDENSTKFEDILAALEVERQKMEAGRHAAETMQSEAMELQKNVRKERDEISKRNEEVIAKAQKEAEEIIQNARKTADAALDEIGRLRRAAKDDISAVNIGEARAAMRGSLNSAQEQIYLKKKKRIQERAEKPNRPFKPGDDVEIIKIGTRGTVISEQKADGTVEVQAGILKMAVKADEIRMLRDDEKSEKVKVRYSEKTRETISAMSSKTELDIRGQNAEEAIMELDKFIDNAVLAKLTSVTIIHGKGTGVLRAAVHDRLKKNKLVKNFRLGRFGEGENGVTVVELK